MEVNMDIERLVILNNNNFQPMEHIYIIGIVVDYTENNLGDNKTQIRIHIPDIIAVYFLSTTTMLYSNQMLKHILQKNE